MRILIDNVSIFTLSGKGFIDRGYVYVDKGTVVAIGEGVPPPELEFADYIINGGYSVVLPGFVVGIGNIVDYIFRSRQFAHKKLDIVSTLSLSDIESLSILALATFALNGATSVATYVSPLSHKLLAGLAVASSECWVRLRIIIPVDDLDASTIEDMVKNAIKSVKDPDAVSKGIVSFGFYADKGLDKGVVEMAKALNIKLYVSDNLAKSELLKPLAKESAVVVRQGDTVDIPVEKVVVTDVGLWRHGVGLASLDPLTLNPRIFISTISKALRNPIDVISILSHYNPQSINIGTGSIDVSSTADLIILDYSKPPAGPIPISVEDIATEVALANYVVDTVLVAGEITVDQGLTLNVGEKHVKRAQLVLDSLRSKQ